MSEPVLPDRAPDPSPAEASAVRPTSGIELERPEQFPAIDSAPRASLWTVALQFFVAPMAIAAAAVVIFVIASTVSTREPTIEDVVAKIRDGGRNERAQACYDLALALNERRRRSAPLTERERTKIRELFEYLLRKELEVSTSGGGEEPIPLRFLALSVGLAGVADAGPLLAEALASRDSELRGYSIIALGMLQQPRHVPEIVQVLRADEEAQVRSIAAWIMGSLLRSDAETRSDPTWESSVALARESLDQAMRRDRSPIVRANATVALAVIGGPTAAEGLVTLIDGWTEAEATEAAPSASASPAAALRADVPASLALALEQAIKAADKLGDPSVVPALERLAARTTNVKLRLRAQEVATALRARTR